MYVLVVSHSRRRAHQMRTRAPHATLIRPDKCGTAGVDVDIVTWNLLRSLPIAPYLQYRMTTSTYLHYLDSHIDELSTA
jgi:hypothetical protein